MEFTENVQFYSTDGINYADAAKDINKMHLTIKAYTNETDKEPTKVENPTDTPNNDQSNEPNQDGNESETPKVEPNTDADIKVEENEYNSNQNENQNGSTVDTPIENPQTGWYIPLAILLVITLLGIFGIKTYKNKIFKI